MSPSPNPKRHRLATTLLLLVVGGGLSVMTAQDAGKQPAGKGEAKAKGTSGKPGATPEVPPPPAPTQGLIPFGKMLPVGQKHLGLEIPNFKEGAPSSTVRAHSMTRVDDENMLLEKMDIRMFGPPQESEKDLRVQLRTASYHMPSNVVASNERSRISRADFDLQGDSLVFDTATGQGKMVGNVQMVIHDSSGFTKTPGEKPKDAPEEKKTPPAGRVPAPIAPSTEVGPGPSPTNPKK